VRVQLLKVLTQFYGRRTLENHRFVSGSLRDTATMNGKKIAGVVYIVEKEVHGCLCGLQNKTTF
jgi:hypothetical protein